MINNTAHSSMQPILERIETNLFNKIRSHPQIRYPFLEGMPITNKLKHVLEAYVRESQVLSHVSLLDTLAEAFVNVHWDTTVGLLTLQREFKNRPKARRMEALRLQQLFQEITLRDAEFPGNLAATKAKISCKKGCNWCCGIQTALFGPEANLIKQLASKEQKAHASKTAIEEGDEELFGKHSFEDRLCPFNKDKSCTIYEQRPISCRAMSVVSNPDDCEGYHGVTQQFVSISGEIFISCCGALYGQKWLRKVLSK